MKKRMARLVCMVLAMLMICGAALADDVITVTGTATVQLEPDMVNIVLGVTATHEEVLSAQEAVNAAMADVVAALTGEELAIAPEDIATTEYRIEENYKYESSLSRGGEYVADGYIATAMLSVCVRNIDQAGAVIDAAMKAGANQLSGVEFASSDQTAARDQALTYAVQDGMRKAKVIAAAAGTVIPAVPSTITEQSSYSYAASNRLYAYAETSDAAAGTQLQAGLLNVTATVTLTYEID